MDLASRWKSTVSIQSTSYRYSGCRRAIILTVVDVHVRHVRRYSTFDCQIVRDRRTFLTVSARLCLLIASSSSSWFRC